MPLFWYFWEKFSFWVKFYIAGIAHLLRQAQSGRTRLQVVRKERHGTTFSRFRAKFGLFSIVQKFFGPRETFDKGRKVCYNIYRNLRRSITMERIVEDWLRRVGLKNTKVKFGDYSQYDGENDIITIGTVPQRATAAYFQDFLQEFFGLDNGIKDYPGIILAFLHEVGHAKTLHDFPDEELLCYQWLKEGAQDYRAYWCVPDEFAANEWAVGFLTNADEEDLEQLWAVFLEISAKYGEQSL